MQHRLDLLSPSLVALRYLNSISPTEGMAALIYGLIFSGGRFQSVQIARTDEFWGCGDGWAVRYYVGMEPHHKDREFGGNLPDVTVRLFPTRLDLLFVLETCLVKLACDILNLSGHILTKIPALW